MKKKLQLEVIDPVGNVVTTHHFNYEAGMNNRLRLTIGDNVLHLDKDGDFTMLTEEQFDKEPELNVGKQWANEFKARTNDDNIVNLGEGLDTKHQYAFNKDTGETQRLFDEKTLIPCFTVGCTNDNIVNGDKGCAVYITVEAEDEFHAMDKAMLSEEFMSHIRDKQNFERIYLHVHKPTGNYVIGKVLYYEGDPRL